VEPTVPKPILHIADILRWADAYYQRIGKWPKQRSGTVPEAIDTTWYGIDKAIADYTEAIRLDPNLALAYNSRGIAYQKIGEEAKAAADFVKAKQLGFEP